jgi:hypothetical protein
MKYHYDLNIQLGTTEGHKINRVQSLTQVQLMNLDIISNQHYVHCRAETTKSSKIIIQQRWDHFSSMEC